MLVGAALVGDESEVLLVVLGSSLDEVLGETAETETTSKNGMAVLEVMGGLFARLEMNNSTSRAFFQTFLSMGPGHLLAAAKPNEGLVTNCMTDFLDDTNIITRDFCL